MSTLLYGLNRAPVPANETEVRSTVTAVQDDAPAAVQTAPPGYNDMATDPDTEGGLTTRQLASYVIPSERYAPAAGNANTDFTARIDGQVSTSGTAAAREASGAWGHGTLKIVEGIEPVLRDGNRLGSEYFTASEREPTSLAGVSPSQTADPDTTADAAATGAANARAAYGAFLASATGIR